MYKYLEKWAKYMDFLKIRIGGLNKSVFVAVKILE
jgi:hypothetical protein